MIKLEMPLTVEEAEILTMWRKLDERGMCYVRGTIEHQIEYLENEAREQRSKLKVV